jgi:putative nucleotidyltransferase with HDIG domain
VGVEDCIAKPYDPIAFIERLRKHVGQPREHVLEQKARPTIQTLLHRLRELPTLPEIVLKVQQVLNDPEVTADQVAQVIELDQSITVKLLRLVNSPLFVMRREAHTVEEAVVRLGFDAVQNILLSVSALDTLQRISGSKGIEQKAFWKHSIACGAIAQFLSRQTQESDQALCFTAGILHDVGKVILMAFCPGEFAQITHMVQTQGVRYTKAEEAVVRMNHTDIGHHLAKRWNLPMEIRSSIQQHHTPAKATLMPELDSIIHVADGMAWMVQADVPDASHLSEIDEHALQTLGIARKMVDEWLPAIQKDTQNAYGLLGILAK